MRTITLRLDDDLHKEIKLKTVIEGGTIQNYIVGLIKEDLRKGKTSPAIGRL